MPALKRRQIRVQHAAPGKCRTSLEGRNRVMLPVRVSVSVVHLGEFERLRKWMNDHGSWKVEELACHS